MMKADAELKNTASAGERPGRILSREAAENSSRPGACRRQMRNSK